MNSKDDSDRRGFLGKWGRDWPSSPSRPCSEAGKSSRGCAALYSKGQTSAPDLLPGAVSHLDTFDYKPELQRRSGEPLPGAEKLMTFQGKNGNLMGSPWGFTRRGQSGKWISDLLPHLGGLVDDMAFIHSMTSENQHSWSRVCPDEHRVCHRRLSQRGRLDELRARVGERQPAHFRRHPRHPGTADRRPANWSSGFLPAEHAATAFNAAAPIRDLHRPPQISQAAELDSRELLALMNHRYSERYPGNPVLSARQSAYELAARMQLSAPEVSDLSSNRRRPANSMALTIRIR